MTEEQTNRQTNWLLIAGKKIKALNHAIIIRHQNAKIFNKTPNAIKIEVFIHNNDAYEAIY